MVVTIRREHGARMEVWRCKDERIEETRIGEDNTSGTVDIRQEHDE